MESLSGRELNKLRETKGLSLDTVAQATKLRVSIIEAIENDAGTDLLSPIYMDLSRRTYARYLAEIASMETGAKQEAGNPAPAKQPATADKTAGKR